MTSKRFNWKIFLVLWLAAIGGVIAVMPYTLALEAPALQRVKIPIPLTILIPIQIAQNAVILGVAVAAGLFLAHRVGLGAPILEGFFAHERIGERLRALLVPSIWLGVVASLGVIVLDAFVFGPLAQSQLGGLAPNVSSSGQPAAWQGLLAAFYGGIDEEILMRLFLLSLFAFLGKFARHTAEGAPTLGVLWTANVVVAILFGLGHLPVTSLIVSITPLIVVRAVVLNGLAGLAFGYLYFTRGLESAMISHFSADLVLHVFLAL